MFIKDPMTLLAECATSDLLADTDLSIEESSIIKKYNSIEEASREIKYDAEVVPVVSVDEQFFTEMNWLSAYMRSNDIKSITEALDNVAEANKLAPHSVGLLIESSDNVLNVITKVIGGSKKHATLGKISKGEALADKLKSKGYPVKRKKSSKK
jgi:hypothetical protein